MIDEKSKSQLTIIVNNDGDAYLVDDKGRLIKNVTDLSIQTKQSCKMYGYATLQYIPVVVSPHFNPQGFKKDDWMYIVELGNVCGGFLEKENIQVYCSHCRLLQGLMTFECHRGDGTYSIVLREVHTISCERYSFNNKASGLEYRR